MLAQLLDHLRRILLRTWRSRVVRLSVAGTLIVVILANIVDRNLLLRPARTAGARLETAFTTIATMPERIMLRWYGCDRDWRLYCLRPKELQDEILALAAYDLSNEDWLRRPIGSELSFRLDATRDRWLAATGGDLDCYAYPARNLIDRAPPPPPPEPPTPVPGEPSPPGADLDIRDIIYDSLFPAPAFWQRLHLAGEDFQNAEKDRRMLAELAAPFDEKAFGDLVGKLASLRSGFFAHLGTQVDAAALTERLTRAYRDFDDSRARLGAARDAIRPQMPSEAAATRTLAEHIADPDETFQADPSAVALHGFLFRPQVADKSARFAAVEAVLLLARNAAKAQAKLAIAEADLQMLELYRRLHILLGRDAAVWAPEPTLAIVDVPVADRAIGDAEVLAAVTAAFEDRKDTTPRLPEVRVCFPTGQTPWGLEPRTGFFGSLAFATAAVASLAINGVMGPIDAVAALRADDRLAGNLVIASYLLIVAVSFFRLSRRATTRTEILVGVPEILVLSAVWTSLGIVVGRWLFAQLVAAVGLTGAMLAWPPIYVATLVYPKLEKAVGFTLAAWTRVRHAAARPVKPS